MWLLLAADVVCLWVVLPVYCCLCLCMVACFVCVVLVLRLLLLVVYLLCCFGLVVLYARLRFWNLFVRMGLLF